MIVEYHSNNSGGSDWLNEKAWLALSKAGWKLFGFGNFEYVGGKYVVGSGGLPTIKGDVESPKYAFKQFNTIAEAMREFEELTGEDITAEGCNCCGAPHSFTRGACVGTCDCTGPHKDYNFSSGEENGGHLLGVDLANLTKRKLITRLRSTLRSLQYE